MLDKAGVNTEQTSHQDIDKPVSVFNSTGQYLSNCTKRRAAQMTARNKAKWIGYNQVMLLITQEDEKRIRKEARKLYGDVCYICDIPLDKSNMSYDHMTPRSRDGEESVENLRPCCRPCNEDKARRTFEEYLLVIYVRVWLQYKLQWTGRDRNDKRVEKGSSAGGIQIDETGGSETVS